jgi:large subunit ribosomal protein L21
MAYAVIKTGGKQYRVSVGDKLDVEKIETPEGDNVTFENVLAAGEGDSLRIGTPFLNGASVIGKVLNQFKGEKVTAFKFRRRKGYHRKKGHRQLQTKVEITSINA